MRLCTDIRSKRSIKNLLYTSKMGGKYIRRKKKSNENMHLWQLPAVDNLSKGPLSHVDSDK